MSLGWNPCLSPQAILSPPIIDRCSFSLVQLLNPRSYTCPFHQYCNVFPYAQRNNHIVVLTPRCQGLFQTFLASSGSEYPVAFRTSWSQVSRWCVEIVGGYWVVFWPSVWTEDCEFTLPRPSVVRITAFQAQDGDALVINDQAWDDLEGGLF